MFTVVVVTLTIVIMGYGHSVPYSTALILLISKLFELTRCSVTNSRCWCPILSSRSSRCFPELVNDL